MWRKNAGFHSLGLGILERVVSFNRIVFERPWREALTLPVNYDLGMFDSICCRRRVLQHRIERLVMQEPGIKSIFNKKHLCKIILDPKVKLYLGGTGPVSYTHLTLPTICSV